MPIRNPSESGAGRRHVAGSRVAERSLDKVVHQGNRDVRHEQAGDGFVDAAEMPQKADGADPGPASQGGDGHHAADPEYPGQRRVQHREDAGGHAAKHDSPLATDHDHAETGRQRRAQGREQ